MALRNDRPAYVVLMSALCALPPLSIDMGLPALTELQHGLHASASMAGLTLSLFMAGFATTPLVYGLLSDRYGRRPLLIAGLAVFALGGLACTVAPTAEWLLAARFLQGAGAGAGQTIAFAATRDQLQGRAMSRRLAALAMLQGVAPAIAPSLGAIVLGVGGWRSIYAALAAFGFLLLGAVVAGFGETLAPSAGRRGALLPDLLKSMRRVFAERRTLAYGAIFGISAGSMFAYVAGSPLVLIGVFGVSSVVYAWLFAGTAVGIVCGAFLSGRLAQRLSSDPILTLGLALSLGAPLLAGALVLANVATLARMVPCLVAATFGFGLVAPAASHAALEPVPEISGTAAALMNTFQMACMSLSSLMVALLFPLAGTIAMPATMVIFAAVAVVVLIGLGRFARPMPAASARLP